MILKSNLLTERLLVRIQLRVNLLLIFQTLTATSFPGSLEHLERATVGKPPRTIASQEPTICLKGAGQLVA
jgi:hypothetical protein